MVPRNDTNQQADAFAAHENRTQPPEPGNPEDIRLRRWLVSFGSGQEMYPVGEFLALDAASAIARAVEIFGQGAGYRAEEIPWDAAPLHTAVKRGRAPIAHT